VNDTVRRRSPLAVFGLAVVSFLACSQAALADRVTLRIATGHPPGVVYAGLMKDYFQTELKSRVESRTEHTVNFVEGYSGSIVRTAETLEGVRDNIIDIGGFCFCFEPSNLPLHAFQVMLPFGTMDPAVSLQIAQDVYSQVPFLTEVFEERFNQKLLARIADAGYNLSTTFDWSSVEELDGVKVAGAGLNLNWLRYAGATPVQSSLPEAYTGLRTNVYEGWVVFPSAALQLKLYEPAPFYTLIGFGSMTWHGLTINLDTWNRLPADFQEILLEVSADYEQQTGSNNLERYSSDVETLRGLITVNELGEDVRRDWANSLGDWPREMAAELDAQGLPATQVLRATLESAERHGYTWPVRYELD